MRKKLLIINLILTVIVLYLPVNMANNNDFASSSIWTFIGGLIIVVVLWNFFFKSQQDIEQFNDCLSYITDDFEEDYYDYLDKDFEEDIDTKTKKILDSYNDRIYEYIRNDYENGECGYEKRIVIWNKYIEKAKEEGYISPQAEGYVEIAELYECMENYTMAIENWSEAIKLIRGNQDYYESRADSYEKIGRYKEAIKDYTSAMKYIKLYYKKWENKSSEELQQYAIYSSIEDLADQTRWDIGSGCCHRGIDYYNLHLYDEAIQDLKFALFCDDGIKLAEEYLSKALKEKDNGYVKK